MKKKILALGIGMLVTFILIEIAIRVAAFSYEKNQEILNSQTSYKNKRVINVVAIGESTTAVAANEARNLLVQNTAYPVYLEKKLNQEIPDHTFKVYNLGIVGGTTDNVVFKLADFSTKVKPDIIVSMMGMKDSQFTKPAKNIGSLVNLQFDWATLGEYSKVVKWIELFLIERENRSQSLLNVKGRTIDEKAPANLTRLMAYSAVQFLLSEMSGVYEPNTYRQNVEQIVAINYYNYTGDYAKALANAKDLIAKNNHGYFALFNTYLSLNDLTNAEKTMLSYLEKNPRNPFAYAKLIYIYQLQNDGKKIKEITDKVNKLNPALENRFSIDIELAQYQNKLNKPKEALNIALKYGNEFPIKDTTLYNVEEHKSKKNREKKKYKTKKKFINSMVIASDFAQSFFHRDQEANYHYVVSEMYINAKMYDEAEKHLLYFINVEKERSNEGALLLRRIYQLRNSKDKSKEEAILKHLVNDSFRLADIYELADFMRANNRAADAEDTYQLIEKILPATIYNYHQTYLISKKYKAALIFMQYPTFSVDILHHFTKDPGILFLSNEHIFDSAPRTEFLYEPRYPNHYNHYTPRGSEVLAGNVASFIKTQIKEGKIKL